MATSFSDMMNEPMVYSLGYIDSSSNGSNNKSASLSMQHNQMMTSPVAPTIIPTVTTTATPIDNQYHDIQQQQQQQYYYQQYAHHMQASTQQQPPPPPVVMPSQANVDTYAMSQFLQNNTLKQQQPTLYMSEHVTPAPVVKSQAHPNNKLSITSPPTPLNNNNGYFIASNSNNSSNNNQNNATGTIANGAPPVPQGFVFNPTTPNDTTITSPTSPMDYSTLQYATTTSTVNTTTSTADQYVLLQQQAETMSSPMMVDYQGFQMTPQQNQQSGQVDNTSDLVAAMYHHQQQNMYQQQQPTISQDTTIASYTPIVPSNVKVPMVSPSGISGTQAVGTQSMMDMLMMAESDSCNNNTNTTTVTTPTTPGSNVHKKSVSRRRSTITSKDSPDLQPNTISRENKRSSTGSAAAAAGTTTSNTRRNLPRRHTVSGGASYQRSNNKTIKESNEEQQKVRKLLKAKRHRSLGKLEMPTSATASPILDGKWFSPETATTGSPSSSICSPLLSGSEIGIDQEQQQMLLLEKLTQHTCTTAESVAPPTPQDEDEEKHQCLWENCYLDMESLDELIIHVKDMHIGSGKALYYCGWKDCPRNQKPFTKRHKMHNHLRTHTGERPFECKEPGCGKRFSRPDSLTTHSKIHSNVRPYLCAFENCGKAYYHLRSLRKHERTHEVRSEDGTSDNNRAINSNNNNNTNTNSVQQGCGTSVSHALDNPVTNLVPQQQQQQQQQQQSGDTLLDWCGTSAAF